MYVCIWQLKCQQRQTNTNKLTTNTNFSNQNKNNVVVYQLSNEYWVSWIAYIIMFEHFKYCIQLTEYWLNKSAYLDIVYENLLECIFFLL